MFGGRGQLEKHLGEHGQRASAKIVAATEGRWAVTRGNPDLVRNTQLTWRLTLQVLPEGAPPFEAELKDRLPQLDRPAVGSMVGVIYDPADHSKLMIDRSAAAAKEAGARGLQSAREQQARDRGASAEEAGKVGDDAYLRRTGGPGMGTITAVRDTGKTGAYDTHELEVTLNVTPTDGGEAHSATMVQFVGPMAMWRYKVGSQVKVAVDPNDPTHVVLRQH